MRNTIIVSISELRSLIQDARRTGKEYVKLSILDPLDDDDGEPVPAELSICAFDSSECIEFETIYAPENESELSDSLIDTVHMSSNLL
jgi:hypothetical protein